MSWIVINSNHLEDFIRIESEWLRRHPVGCQPARHTSTSDGEMKIDVPTVFLQHLRDANLVFREVELYNPG